VSPSDWFPAFFTINTMKHQLETAQTVNPFPAKRKTDEEPEIGVSSYTNERGWFLVGQATATCNSLKVAGDK
jgi:hypothetical protein